MFFELFEVTIGSVAHAIWHESVKEKIYASFMLTLALLCAAATYVLAIQTFWTIVAGILALTVFMVVLTSLMILALIIFFVRVMTSYTCRR